VPATLVLTEPFIGLAASFAATLGLPGYPVVALPHPVATKTDDELRELAARFADVVVQRLIVGPAGGS
jgi:hypothetical protein